MALAVQEYVMGPAINSGKDNYEVMMRQNRFGIRSKSNAEPIKTHYLDLIFLMIHNFQSEIQMFGPNGIESNRYLKNETNLLYNQK